MAAVLTLKEENFAQAFVELGVKAEAYRQAYDASNMKDEVMHIEAVRVSKRPRVALRIKELRDDIQIAAMWSKVDSVKALAKIAGSRIKVAEIIDDSDSDPGTDNSEIIGSEDKDIIAATKAINAMFGWDKKVIDNISSDGSMTPEKGKSLDDFYDSIEPKDVSTKPVP